MSISGPSVLRRMGQIPVQRKKDEMKPKEITREELKKNASNYTFPKVMKWLEEGDGVAMYQNTSLTSKNFGRMEYRRVTRNSEIPEVLPERIEPSSTRMPSQVEWNYLLLGVCW